MWRRGRLVGDVVRPEVAGPVPIEVTGRGRAGRAGVQDPVGDAPVAAAVWVPVEPVVSAVRFVVRRPGGGGALHDVDGWRHIGAEGKTTTRITSAIEGGSTS
eukprot:scaffold8059_cov62-Phaeocystis_antarctica.AAC.4